MKFNNENEIIEIIDSFETAVLPSINWKHREHLLLAAYFTASHDYETALEKMRSGILKLNDFHGVVTTPERGYHETLTCFWVKVISEYVKQNKNRSFFELVNEMIDLFDKDYPLKFYSREVLFSVEARFGFVEADLVKQ